jgi:hypothetical protein
MSTSAQAASAAAKERPRAPDFFVVGHPKSGTTALYDMLNGHPQIFMPANKEPWFFAEEIRSSPSPRPRGTGWTPQSLADYLALFGPAGREQRTGEASCLYLWSHTAAREIAALNPDAKVVAILREPTSFLRSLHLQFVQTYLEGETDFAKALALEPARRQRGEGFDAYWPQATMYSQFVTYVEQLRRYHDVLAGEQVLVLIYDDYRSDNAGTVRLLQRFLEVDDSAPVRVRDANPTVSVRSRRIYELAHRVAVGEGPLARVVRGGVQTLAPRSLSKERAIAIRNRLFFRDPEPPDEELVRALRRRFKPEVEALSDYLGRDLVTLWGYDQTD